VFIVSASKYVKLTPEEKRRLEESVESTFGEDRISYGAFIAYLCEQHSGGEE
jgi:hypothetical protein